MTVLEILDTLLLRPLQLLFEVIYMVADRIIGNPFHPPRVVRAAVEFSICVDNWFVIHKRKIKNNARKIRDQYICPP